MNTAPRLPTLQEEIDRKTMEEFEKIIHAVNSSSMTVEQAERALMVLWSVTAGLVDNEVSVWITAYHSELKSKCRHREITVLRKDHITVIVKVWYQRGVVLVRQLNPNSQDSVKKFDFSKDDEPTISALEKAKRIIAHFVEKGYEEL